jgi:hypothetical protein
MARGSFSQLVEEIWFPQYFEASPQKTVGRRLSFKGGNTQEGLWKTMFTYVLSVFEASNNLYAARTIHRVVPPPSSKLSPSTGLRRADTTRK